MRHVDKPHALTIPRCSFNCELGTLPSGQVENGGISPVKRVGYQLLLRVGLTVRLMELNVGVVSVRAVQTMMGPVLCVIITQRT
jgi:hypothetical protein